jgi:hypothetical protein
MTFIFLKEDLHELTEQELRVLHSAVCTEVETQATTASLTSMNFRGFELFPPGKRNQVAALFEPSPPLKQLRVSILSRFKASCPSLPARFWRDVEDDGDWLPHVTLGKIGATTEQVGRLCCQNNVLTAMTPLAAWPRGITLLGERPKRAWLDWDEALSFAAMRDEAQCDTSTSAQWKAYGQQGMTALQRAKVAAAPSNIADYRTAIEAFRKAVVLRPDVVKGREVFTHALKLLGECYRAEESL